MKEKKRRVYFTKADFKKETDTNKKTANPTEDPISIGMNGKSPRWDIPEDVIDEMLADLRDEENAAHE